MTMSSPAAPHSSAGFEREASTRLNALRASLTAMFHAASGGLRKSADAQKLFGIDAKLSWQVFKLTGAGEVLSLAPHVPAAQSIRRLLQAAKKRNVPVNLIENVRNAYSAFEELVETYAGDRQSFDVMASGFAPSSEERQMADLANRKAITNGYRHFYGVEVETWALTYLIGPARSGAKDLFDFAYLRTKVGMCRFRADAALVVDTAKNLKSPNPEDAARRETFFPDATETYHAPIMPPFCTSPLPQLKTEMDEDGRTWTLLEGESIGRQWTADLVFGNIWRDAPMDTDGKRWFFGIDTNLPYPTKQLVVDVLAHRSTLPELEASFSVTRHLFVDNKTFGKPRVSVKLPFQERVQAMGSAEVHCHMREVPQYLSLVGLGAERLGRPLGEFDLYRLRIEYPLIDTFFAFDYSALRV